VPIDRARPVSEVWRTMRHSRTRLRSISVSLWPSRTCLLPTNDTVIGRINPHEDRVYHDTSTGFAAAQTTPDQVALFYFPSVLTA
jgi:hypothetical protein